MALISNLCLWLPPLLLKTKRALSSSQSLLDLQGQLLVPHRRLPLLHQLSSRRPIALRARQVKALRERGRKAMMRKMRLLWTWMTRPWRRATLSNDKSWHLSRHDIQRMGFGFTFTFEAFRCLFSKPQENLGSGTCCGPQRNAVWIGMARPTLVPTIPNQSIM